MEEINELIRTATFYSYIGQFDEALQHLLEAFEIGMETFNNNKAAPELCSLYMKLIKIYAKLGNMKKEQEFLLLINDCQPEQNPATNAELIHFVTDIQFQQGSITAEDAYKQLLLAFKTFQKYQVHSVQAINIVYHFFTTAAAMKQQETANEALQWIRDNIIQVCIKGKSDLEIQARNAVTQHLDMIQEKLQEIKSQNLDIFEDSFEDIGEL
ncbi:hypothetical protein SS50377_24485 [Spironucleus salmonicida]|uniref:Tetratricopeptide repeat protein n=1 Tax=Spironucleus salmonicida TaxID=348837 RepID=V6LMW3_9EUKA|nr:hypothetical protein SS50377_24485 [Spironucleus salmonicida]|eukprot:EST45970.1 Hypothetical protein SS50377_13949 [Spironucleus salmonicida]